MSTRNLLSTLATERMSVRSDQVHGAGTSCDETSAPPQLVGGAARLCS